MTGSQQTSAGKLWASLVVAAFCLNVLWAPAALAGKADNSLVWAANKEVMAVDPYFDTSREALVIAGHVYDGLVYWNPANGEFEPLLATKWTWVNPTTLEFDLRPGVVFHDGSSFGPEDVVYTIGFMKREESGVLNYGDTKWLQSAEQVDADTVRIHLVEPFPAALANLALTLPILPDKHFDAAPVLSDGKKAYTAVPANGTGPYRVTHFKPGERVELAANPRYFNGGAKPKPAIQKLVYRTIADESTQIAELMTGGVDWIWGLTQDQAAGLAQAPNLKVMNAPTMRFSYLCFDLKGKSGSDVFTKRDVRRALGHAIDREAIAKSFMGTNSQVVNAACHPVQFGCSGDVAAYGYDPEKARALLAAAGYPNGFTFDIYGYREREVVEAIIGDLAKVGVTANLRYLKYSALRELVVEGKTGVANMTWGSSSIPDTSASASYFFGGGPDDPATDAEVMAAVREGDTSTDPAVRKAAYARALKKIAEEAYWIPLFTYTKNYAFAADLEFTPTPDEFPRFFTSRWK